MIMGSTLAQCYILALLATFLLCGIEPNLAAPAHRQATQTYSCSDDCNVSADAEWYLEVGLLTTILYTVSQQYL